MLFFNTIERNTLGLLNRLMLLEGFKDLLLVGGTSLALQIGHRKSDDLDLFGKLTPDSYEITRILKDAGELQLLNQSKNIHSYLIDTIKVDLVNYEYPWIDKPVICDNIRMAGEKDIAAMKLSAITGRGSKKDFIDIYFLMEHFSLKQLLGFYREKYSEGSEFLVLKSLAYYDDAENEPLPYMIKEIHWESVKKSISINLETYLKDSMTT